MTTKRISLEGVEARNDLIKFGVEEALVSSEGTLVLGEKSDSLFKASESLGTSVISHRREAMKAPKMIATKLKDNELISHELEARRCTSHPHSMTTPRKLSSNYHNKARSTHISLRLRV